MNGSKDIMVDHGLETKINNVRDDSIHIIHDIVLMNIFLTEQVHRKINCSPECFFYWSCYVLNQHIRMFAS